jgi:hypothetical protein
VQHGETKFGKQKKFGETESRETKFRETKFRETKFGDSTFSVTESGGLTKISKNFKPHKSKQWSRRGTRETGIQF